MLALAGAGDRVVLLGRSAERAAPVVDRLRSAGAVASHLSLDLASLDSIRSAAPRLEEAGPVDLVIADAGLAGVRGATRDGFELAFGVNHLGHFALIDLLHPQLAASPEPRVVIVASDAHRGAQGIDWRAVRRPTRSLTGFPEYRVSKLCNVLHARELARRRPALEVAAVHPGMVATDMWRRVPQPARWWMTRRMLTAEQGAETVVHCATSPAGSGRSGAYWARGREREPSDLAADPALAAELWERSAEWTR